MKQNTFLSYLASRNKLSFQNIRTGENYWHIFVSRIYLVGIVIAVLLLSLTGAMFLVAYTPLMDYIPGNPGEKQRQLLMQNIMTLDSLEAEIELWGQYNSNVLMALEGKVPQVESVQAIEKDPTIKTPVQSRNIFDSLLRVKHSRDSSYLNSNSGMSQKQVKFEVMSPSPGMIVSQFDLESGKLGIVITPPAEQIIIAALDGTVILNSWSPEGGNTIAIQHASNVISIYKNLAQTLCSVGEQVTAGAPVGVAPNAVGGKRPEIGFELWAKGMPLNPQQHIAF